MPFCDGMVSGATGMECLWRMLHRWSCSLGRRRPKFNGEILGGSRWQQACEPDHRVHEVKVVHDELIFGRSAYLRSPTERSPGWHRAPSELFGMHNRGRIASISMAIAVVVVGIGPYISSWLISSTKLTIAPAFYIMAVAIITFAVALNLSRGVSLRARLPPLRSSRSISSASRDVLV